MGEVASCLCGRQPPTLDIGDVSLAISKVSLMWFHLNYLRVSLMRQQKVCHCKYSEHSTDTHPTHTDTHTHAAYLSSSIATCWKMQLHLFYSNFKLQPMHLLLDFNRLVSGIGAGWQHAKVARIGGRGGGQGVASIPSRLLGKIRKSHLASQVLRVTIFRVTRAWHFWRTSRKKGNFQYTFQNFQT